MSSAVAVVAVVVAVVVVAVAAAVVAAAAAAAVVGDAHRVLSLEGRVLVLAHEVSEEERVPNQHHALVPYQGGAG